MKHYETYVGVNSAGIASIYVRVDDKPVQVVELKRLAEELESKLNGEENEND